MLEAVEQVVYVQSVGGDGIPRTRAFIGKNACEH